MAKSYFFIFLCGFFSTSLLAQNPVQWEFAAKQLNGDEYEVTLTAKVEDGWNIYSQHTADGGPLPTTFYFTESTDFELLGEITETGKKKEAFDDLFGVNVSKFVGDVVFTQKVKAIKKGAALTGYLEFMCCDGEKCLPPKDVDFSIPLE